MLATRYSNYNRVTINTVTPRDIIDDITTAYINVQPSCKRREEKDDLEKSRKKKVKKGKKVLPKRNLFIITRLISINEPLEHNKIIATMFRTVLKGYSTTIAGLHVRAFAISSLPRVTNRR